jgi:hypothetical protein
MQIYAANGLYLMYKPDVHLIGIHLVCISSTSHLPCYTLRVYSNTITELSDRLNHRRTRDYFK